MKTTTIMNLIRSLQPVKEMNAKVTLHLKGEQAYGNEALEQFIKTTNQKYYNSDSDKLLGDFIEIASENNSFIRISVDLIKDKTTEEIIEYVNDNISYAHIIHSDARSIVERMEDYEQVKNSLIIRPLNYNFNQLVLGDYVYDTIGDIALVLYAVVLDDKANNCLNTIKVPKQAFEKWNLSKADVMYEAMQNTMVFAGPRIYTNLLNMYGTTDRDSDFMKYDIDLREAISPMVTTTRKTNGAVAMFYPGVKEKLAEMLDGSFYIAFTSIHEAMIHKVGTLTPEAIRRSVRNVNEHFNRVETLSNDVFLFNKEDGTFTVAE